MRYLYDYHIHTDYSIDGKNSMFEVCKSAIENGLSEISITDHYEITENNRNYIYFRRNDYWNEIINLRETFKGKIKIKIGIEIGQPHLFPLETKEIINSIPFDYIIGSAHKFPKDLDASQIDYKSFSIDDICEKYINQLKHLATIGDFDCIGHIDLIKRYSAGIYESKVTLMRKVELLKETFKVLIERGKGIEINTSGLRQGPKETMPGIDVLKLYRQIGGEVITLGSDAHCAADVGKGIVEALEIAKQAGFKYLTVFNNRVPEWIKIEDRKDFSYISRKVI